MIQLVEHQPPEQPETLDEREQRVVDAARSWFEHARQHRATWGEDAAVDPGPLRALGDELAAVADALRADLPRRVIAREEAIVTGGRTLLSVDDGLRDFKLRLERALILHRRINAKLQGR